MESVALLKDLVVSTGQLLQAEHFTLLQFFVKTTTCLNQGLTLTFDLQNLIRSSVGANEYSVSFLSKL